MLKRINISVFQPSKIAFFLKDKLGYVFLYMALLAFLASLPTIVKQYAVSPLTFQSQQNILGVFIQKDINCSITNAQMACTEPIGFEIDGILIKFNESPDDFRFQVIFDHEKVSLFSGQSLIKSVSYSELGIVNLDFKLSTEADILQFSSALEIFVDEFQVYYATAMSIAIFISNFLLYISIAGIMALSFGFRLEKLIYRYRFIMATYSTTSYFVLALVAELYGIGIILFLGMILPFITMTIAFNGLLQMSKIVIRKKDDEE